MESSDTYDFISNGYIYNFIGNTCGVKILSHISNGGYAQVYKVSYGISNVIGCLKRVIVANKQALNILRAEVDCMRILKDNSAHIVKYIDSNASKFDSNGKYEVLVLMELCENGSLIDYMNTRLNNRFTELEVLNIFAQTCSGIYAMHRLVPPLLHRDIKIENILINQDHQFKLCDFGSVCGIIRPPKNLEELNFVKNDLLSNTTAQYRPPEILKVAVKNEINVRVDEKSDIWALGVFLYKLCYYTTPFEFNNSGNQGILTGSFKFPDFPNYTHNMKTLISWCLQVDATKRPNICEVLEQASAFQGKPCQLENFYKKRKLLERETFEKRHQDQREIMKQNQLKQLQIFKHQQIMQLKENVSTSSSLHIPSDEDSYSKSQLQKTKSLPSSTTTSDDRDNKTDITPFKRAVTYNENDQDPFSDLVTLAKLERHQYTSTTSFEKLNSNDREDRKTVVANNVSKLDIASLATEENNDKSANHEGKQKSSSIHQRFENLLNSDFAVQKSAVGYGNFTNTDKKQEQLIKSKTISKTPKSKTSIIAPEKPKKPQELKAPTIPKKPSSLKAEKIIELDIDKFDKKYPQIKN